jgi:septal ring factor EnvC (AmiA/AmiB activator)
MLTGCIFIINQPSAEEKALVNIQQEVGTKVKSLNEKILTQGADYGQLQSYLAEAQVFLDDSIKKIDELKLPDKAKSAYDSTKRYMESLNRNYQQLKQLFSDLEALKQKGEAMTAMAKTELDKQIKNIKNTVNEVGSQLNRIATGLQNLGVEIMAKYNQTQQTP